MRRALALDEVGVPTDRLGDRVGNVLLVLRSLVGVRQEPRASEESAIELEGELGAVGRKASQPSLERRERGNSRFDALGRSSEVVEETGEVQGLGIVRPLGELHLGDGDGCEERVSSEGDIEVTAAGTHRRGKPFASGSTHSWEVWARGTREQL